MEKTIWIAIKNIDTENFKNYQRFVDKKSDGYEELVKSIKTKGLQNPIIVRHYIGETYSLVDGLHRLCAAKDAGIINVPAYIVS
jgi:ParB family chromosome partitioning protein